MTNEIVVKQSEEMVKVREFERRIFEFLPGAKTIPADIRFAMAQVAIAHGLDPFLREIWPIPVKDRSGQIVGYELMVGIAGWRSSAWRSNEYWGRRFEKCTPEERAWMGAQQNDIALKCIVARRRTGERPMEFDGYGLFKAGHEYTKMNPLQCTRYRAERDAMKAAFPISLPPGVTVKIADEETGEIINGTSHKGPDWGDPIYNQEYATDPDAEPEPDTLDQLTDATQRDAVSNAPQTPAPEPEAPKPEPTTPKANGKRAEIKTPHFPDLKAAVSAKTKHYTNDYHILATVAKLKYTTITDDNLNDVVRDLIQYGLEQDAVKDVK